MDFHVFNLKICNVFKTFFSFAFFTKCKTYVKSNEKLLFVIFSLNTFYKY